MNDPREEKLPKWAQELIYNERLKNALRFPDESAPEPDFKSEGGGNACIGCDVKEVFSANRNGVWKHYVKNGYLYKTPACESFGSQARGSYYLRLEDARLARRWMLARQFASELLAAETTQPRR